MNSIAVAYSFGAQLAQQEFTKDAGLLDPISKAIFEAELKLLSKIPARKHLDVHKGVESLTTSVPMHDAGFAAYLQTEAQKAIASGLTPTVKRLGDPIVSRAVGRSHMKSPVKDSIPDDVWDYTRNPNVFSDWNKAVERRGFSKGEGPDLTGKRLAKVNRDVERAYYQRLGDQARRKVEPGFTNDNISAILGG